MDEFVKLLAPDYTLKSFLIKQGCIVLKIQSAKGILRCPYCGKPSKKVHSMYEREVQDLPLQDNKTILLVGTRKMFCENENCSHKTFTEHHPFVVKNGKKTERLNQSILGISLEMSSVNASKSLKERCISVSKSSICEMLKKRAGACG